MKSFLIKTLALTVLLLAVIHAEAQLNPATGLMQDNNHDMLTISDFASFAPNVANRHNEYRYGFGGGMMEVGTETIGYNGHARNGFTLYGLRGEMGWSPHVGLGLMNADFKLNSNRAYGNYYLYQPDVAVGTMTDLGLVSITANAKAGGSIGNYYSDGLTARTDSAYGWNMFASVFIVELGYDVTYFHDIKRELFDINVLNVIHLTEERDDKDTITGIALRIKYD